MALIDYEQLEDGFDATANLFNERFGQIVDEINGNLDASNIKPGTLTDSLFASSAIERAYPIGSIYMNAANTANPSTYLGFGSWTAFAAGRVLVGIDSGQTEFDTLLETGGHKSLQAHTHTGTTSTGGSHTHSYTAPPGQTILPIHGSGDAAHGFLDGSQGGTTGSSGSHNHTFTTASTGDGNSQNLQPYIVVYMWQRTA